MATKRELRRLALRETRQDARATSRAARMIATISLRVTCPRTDPWSNSKEGRLLRGRLTCGDKTGRGRTTGRAEETKYCQRHNLKATVDPYSNYSLAAAISERNSILKRNDVWIADSGATCHSTFCAQGGRNGKAAVVASQGTSGDEQIPSQVIDLEGCVILSKEGDPGGHCSLTEVNYSEDYNYNLLSLTRMLREGWSIHGDVKAIKMKKDKQDVGV